MMLSTSSLSTCLLPPRRFSLRSPVRAVRRATTWTQVDSLPLPLKLAIEGGLSPSATNSLAITTCTISSTR